MEWENDDDGRGEAHWRRAFGSGIGVVETHREWLVVFGYFHSFCPYDIFFSVWWLALESHNTMCNLVHGQSLFSPRIV
jgi:hypothetical protein